MSLHAASDMARREAVRVARAVLTGEVGVLEGSVALAKLADGVVPSVSDDPDFQVFGAISSEIDGVPIGDVRQQWKGEALTRMDALAQKYADDVRAVAVRACENVVSRFGERDEDHYLGSVV